MYRVFAKTVTYIRVFSCIFVYFFRKKERKFEFQFTHYKPKSFLVTCDFVYLHIVCYIENIAFRLPLGLLEWLKFQGYFFEQFMQFNTYAQLPHSRAQFNYRVISCIFQTSLERHNSAACLRLKNSKRMSKCQVFFCSI